MTPIEIRLRCVEIADRLHIAGASNREDKVLGSAQKILNFVTDNGSLADPADIATTALAGLTGMLSSLTAGTDSEPISPVAEEVKAEKKAKVVKTPAEDKPEA